MSSPTPLFVFGVARSGTNLVAGMLNAHSRIKLALDPLLPFFRALRDEWVCYSNNQDLIKAFPSGVALQDYYFHDFGTDLLDLVWNGNLSTAVTEPKLIEAISQRASLESLELAEEFSTLRGAAYKDVLDNLLLKCAGEDCESLKFVGTKEVWTTEFIPTLLRQYPKARAIIVRRDPRAVVASMTEMSRKDPSQSAHIISYLRHWRKDFAVAIELSEAEEFRSRVSIVKYEDIVSRPQYGIAKLCGFLRLPLEAEMQIPVMGRGGQQYSNSSYGEFKGISPSSLRRWPEVLDEATVATIEFICGPEMVASGYEISRQNLFAKDASIARVFREADANGGSWRCDTGAVSTQLHSELTRLKMCDRLVSFCEDEVRKNFLFEKAYLKCIEAFELD